MVKILRPLPPNLRRRDALDVLRKYARDPNSSPRIWATGGGDRSYAFDRNNQLSDGAAPYAASGYAQADGADAVVDLGGNQAASVALPPIADVSPIFPQRARIDAVIFVAISAMAATGGVSLIAVGSNDVTFGAGNVVQLAQMQLGVAGSQSQPNPFPTPAVPPIGGLIFELLFTNNQANEKYQYLKLYNFVSGTTPSITYRAYVAVLPEE
jgi:hypothetical protein